jgi:5'-methylthioadenosine phosphorylase
MVGHISVADPFCPELRAVLYDAVTGAGGTVHQGGTFIIIEGPRFSTRGESHIYRQWGCRLIGMTTTPEAFLAREAEIAYATMAHITDYDVWHQSEEPVTVEKVIETMHQNLNIAQQAVAGAVAALDESADWACHHVLDGAIMTSPDRISTEMRTRLHAIVGRLLS